MQLTVQLSSATVKLFHLEKFAIYGITSCLQFIINTLILYIATIISNILYIVTIISNILYIATIISNILYIATIISNILYIATIIST